MRLETAAHHRKSSPKSPSDFAVLNRFIFMENQVVRARDLVKNYDSQKAVDGISFDVARGEAFGLLGPNGAGKSTTMRMIACRSPVTSGSLHVEGYDVQHNARDIRRLIGVVPQENNLDPDISVRQNLIVYARYFQMPPADAARRADELLDFTGLNDKINARVEELSGGMKRRLMIARALLHKPRLLVLDEPTTGLDPQVRQEIWSRLEELRRTQNLTILLSTHYMDEAEKLCDRLMIIDKGHIQVEGTPHNLVRDKLAAFALEIRDTGERPLLSVPASVRAVERAGAHLYFADCHELLTPLMNTYEGQRVLLRPTNLEDVFLQFVSDTGNE